MTPPSRAQVLAAACAVCLLATGCGEDEAEAGTLTGDRVARMAEAQLEATHPNLSRGTMVCADLEFTIGATTRCTRTGYLSRGRIVRVLGTVEVTDTDDGGMLHVELDDEVRSFALDGARLAELVAANGALTCPDLEGVVGTSVVCSDSNGAEIPVVVTDVEPETYGIEFEVGPTNQAGS